MIDHQGRTICTTCGMPAVEGYVHAGFVPIGLCDKHLSFHLQSLGWEIGFPPPHPKPGTKTIVTNSVFLADVIAP